jgi:uncharacterized protein (TIGR03435 family)
MKTLFAFAVSLLLCARALSQVLTVGDKVPDVVFADCILPGSPEMVVKNIALKNFAGKVVILDFWATWCGPCIGSMPKYEGFQKKYSDQVQVIGVTHEAVKRIQTFARNRPVSFMLAIDTASALRKYFEYRSIPHVVVVDKSGTIKAITHSDELTEEVLNNIINDRPVSVTLKKDRVDFDFEKNDYFKAPPDTKESFNLQAGIPGVGSMSMVGKGAFSQRRLSMVNFTIDGLYRMAYRVSYYRMVSDIDPKEFAYSEPKNKYALDVIVPVAGDNLYAYMQQQLPKYFDIKARWEKKKMPVMVVKRTQGPLLLSPSTEQSDYFGASSNHFNGTGVKVSALAKFLEDFGIVNMPVLDETNVSGRYTIQLEWQPEKKGHMQEVFRNAGFELVKEEREIEVLVLYR